jgi:hypothetical protein
MAVSESKSAIDGPDWNPGKFAIEREERTEPDGAGPLSILLRHPASPFVRWPRKDDEISLQKSANAYLTELTKRRALDLPPGWLEALTNGTDITFGWLPIGGPARKNYDPLVSFWVERTRDDVPLDRSLVLLASERLGAIPVGSGFGIRVVVHVREDRDRGTFVAQFTGAAVSLPFGPYASDGIRKVKWRSADEAEAFLRSLVGDEIKKQITTRHGLSEVHFRGLRLAKVGAGPWQVERRGVGVSPGLGRTKRSDDLLPFGFALLGTDTDVGAVTSKRLLVADAVPGEARVFPRDPPSQGGPGSWRGSRPTRRGGQLDAYRVLETIGPGLNTPLSAAVLRGDDVLDVIQCAGYVLGDMPGGVIKSVDLPGNGPAVRSNDLAAVSAYRNLLKLFDRLNNYGLAPGAYFRVASLPVKAFYRSGVRPGPGKDGQTVNAQVLPKDWKADFFGPTAPGDHPTLHVHLALANLSHRARATWDRSKRSPAEPVGIAADERWIWHEIGHILLMARVGELEFRFAHSPGDALAAIVADPQSKLASNERWRGATFPWVHIPRRHDRSVLRGWSWCGSMHRALFLLPDKDRDRKKSYWSEQILSSSLFRLYRCLGGDTVQAGTTNPDPVIRESASHYAVYLVMQAIALMPDPNATPINHAADFEDLLERADTVTGLWNVNVPVGQPPVLHAVKRVGGCAHKVIHWAFEAQGMFADNPANQITNGPGRPPPVDIYIKDNRNTLDRTPDGDVDYGEGSYVPVSLDWNGTPKWHAKVGGGGVQEGIERQGANFFVYVGNRGRNPANGVTVNVFGREWPAAAPPPEWDPTPGAWTTYSALPAQNIPVGAVARFGPFSPDPLAPVPPAGARYLVLAQATCVDDPANIDPARGLPCSLQTTPLVDLVAGDNNLGLIEITI